MSGYKYDLTDAKYDQDRLAEGLPYTADDIIEAHKQLWIDAYCHADQQATFWPSGSITTSDAHGAVSDACYRRNWPHEVYICADRWDYENELWSYDEDDDRYYYDGDDEPYDRDAMLKAEYDAWSSEDANVDYLDWLATSTLAEMRAAYLGEDYDERDYDWTFWDVRRRHAGA